MDRRRLLVWMLLVMVAGGVGKAQESMLETVWRLIKAYPDATHRMEYRYEPYKGDTAFREMRFDFRIRRDALRQVDQTVLFRLCDEAWAAADPKTDRMLKYAHGDSVCSTIVYGTDKGNLADLLRHDAVQNFCGNGGYLLFDAGKQVSVVVDRAGWGAPLPQAPSFEKISQAFNRISQGRKVKETRVRYTGKKGSFVFQRGAGKGWTRGKKFSIEACSPADFDVIRKAFLSYFEGAGAVNLIVYNREIMLKNEQGPEFFITSLSPAGTLTFLSAFVEDEICIPRGWETIDCFNNGEVDYVDVSRLDNLYDSLMVRASAAPVEVQYTGSFTSEMRTFAWQRGWGSGWTRGKRFELANLTPDEVDRIFDTFRSYQGVLGYVKIEANGASTYEEGTRTFYGFRVQKDGRAFFLKAITEGEICIPMKWTEMDYFKGTKESGRRQEWRHTFAKADKPVQRLWGLSRLWAAVKQNFVFMDRVPVDWDSLYVAMIPRIMEAKDDYETVRLLQAMVAHMHDGHTYVYDTGGSQGTIPIFTKRIGEKVYVDEVLSSQLHQDGVKRGLELTAINGMTVEAYVRQFVEPYAASSTPQWLNHICYEGSGLMTGRKGDTVRLTLKEGGRTFDVSCVIGSGTWDLWKPRPSLSFSVLENKIGYLKITAFGDAGVTALFDSVYTELLRTRALVIDIRGNGGGNSGYSEYILRHFATDTLRTSSWKSPKYIPAFASWGYPREWFERPSGRLAPIQDKLVYDRPVVLLVDNGTFSAAEDFCEMFRSIKRGLLVGQPTGGSTGNGVRVELIPGVAGANICSKHDTAADGTEFVGYGFMPDVPVEESYMSYFEEERDAALTTALRMLSKSLRNYK